MKVRRSMIIVPANVPGFIEKSRKFDVDVVVLDIQDSVAKVDSAKIAVRHFAAAAVKQGGFRAREVCVRVNSPASLWFIDDIKAMVYAGVDSIRLTHAYGLADVLYAERCIMAFADGRDIDITLSLDMPSALVELEDIARHSTLISSLWLSSGDYSLEMGAQTYGPHASGNDDWLIYTRSKIVSIARAKGWNAGDIVRNFDANHPEDARSAFRRSRAFGFDGTSVASPRLLSIANDVYGVDGEELAWAQKLVAKWKAMDEGPDRDRAFRTIDGKGITAPNYEYACRVIGYHAVLQGDPAATAHYRAHGLASADYLTERRATAIRSGQQNS